MMDNPPTTMVQVQHRGEEAPHNQSGRGGAAGAGVGTGSRGAGAAAHDAVWRVGPRRSRRFDLRVSNRPAEEYSLRSDSAFRVPVKTRHRAYFLRHHGRALKYSLE